jgi:hypothetical protein
MISTIDLKHEQLTKGFYSIGTGIERILIIGSCRSVPYVNYFNENNQGNQYTINYIDPFNWNWDIKDNRTEYEQVLKQCEKDDRILKMLSSTTIFIHEYYANAGMFNCNKLAEKNIYQFGLNPAMDICLPNFNDVFILTSDIVSFDIEIKKSAIQDFNVIGKLSDRTISEIEKVRTANLDRFYSICLKSDFPEFAKIFYDNYKSTRYFHTFNHVSKVFNHKIFELICANYLHKTDFILPEHDMFANSFTSLCEYDYGFDWNEPTKKLKDTL